LFKDIIKTLYAKMSETIVYDDFNVVLSLNTDKIFISLHHQITFDRYEGFIYANKELKELGTNVSIDKCLKIIKSSFEKKDGFELSIKIMDGYVKLDFNVELEYMSVKFDFLLKAKNLDGTNVDFGSVFNSLKENIKSVEKENLMLKDTIENLEDEILMLKRKTSKIEILEDKFNSLKNQVDKNNEEFIETIEILGKECCKGIDEMPEKFVYLIKEYFKREIEPFENELKTLKEKINILEQENTVLKQDILKINTIETDIADINFTITNFEECLDQLVKDTNNCSIGSVFAQLKRQFESSKKRKQNS